MLFVLGLTIRDLRILSLIIRSRVDEGERLVIILRHMVIAVEEWIGMFSGSL